MRRPAGTALAGSRRCRCMRSQRHHRPGSLAALEAVARVFHGVEQGGVVRKHQELLVRLQQQLHVLLHRLGLRAQGRGGAGRGRLARGSRAGWWAWRRACRPFAQLHRWIRRRRRECARPTLTSAVRLYSSVMAAFCAMEPAPAPLQGGCSSLAARCERHMWRSCTELSTPGPPCLRLTPWRPRWPRCAASPRP